MKSKLVIGAVFAITVALSSTAKASVVYTYTGNPFTSPSPPFTSLNASVTLNCTGSCADGTYSFSGGGITDVILTSVLTFDSASGVSNAPHAGFDYVKITGGSITAWLLDNSPPGFIFRTLNDPSIYPIVTDEAGFGEPGLNSDDPGQWTTPSTTPLPAALPLFASGGALLGFLGWRRKRRPVTRRPLQ